LSGRITREDLLNAEHDPLDPLEAKDATQCDIFEHTLEWVAAQGVIARAQIVRQSAHDSLFQTTEGTMAGAQAPRLVTAAVRSG
jgi:hypothetical protein